jgi:hypothetical protein
MTATPQTDFWHEQADDPDIRIDNRIDPMVHEAYWQSVFFGEPYYRRDRDYEDYAPAYCVGYIGYAQYGGSCDDAEKSLCANWLRIKGASRLELDEALQAIRAAWAHAAQAEQFAAAAKDDDAAELPALPLARKAASQRSLATA